MILIDGHNALGALRIRGKTHQDAREQLLQRVAARAPQAIVYFDARNAPPDVLSSQREFGVKVIYCRKKEADVRILDRVRDADAPERVTVVTNDREVRGKARQLGAGVSRIEEFFGPRDDTGAAPAPARKPPGGRRLTPRDFGLPDDVDLDKGLNED